MKPLLTITLFLLLANGAFGADKKISDLPNTSTFQSTDLLLLERPGTGNLNITGSQFPTALGLGTAAFQSTSAFDAANTALNATNGLGVSSQLSAFAPTNQFVGEKKWESVTNTWATSAFGNASGLSSGTVSPTLLGSGTSITTKFLRGDSTWQTIGGGGDMLAANNLSDVANTGTALSNIGGICNNYTGTLTVSGLHVTVGMTNDSLTASTDLESDSNKKIVSLANGGGVKTNNGSGGIGWNTAPNLDLKNATNAINGPTVSAGANITVTLSQNANGSTNTQVAVSDPANFSQVNVGTFWATNTVSPTNAFGGTSIDFSRAYQGTTNLGGNLTFTAVANVTGGAENATILHLIASGADRTIAFPANWHTNLNFIGVVTNGWEMDLLFTIQPSVRTNVAQILYP